MRYVTTQPPKPKQEQQNQEQGDYSGAAETVIETAAEVEWKKPDPDHIEEPGILDSVGEAIGDTAEGIAEGIGELLSGL